MSELGRIFFQNSNLTVNLTPALIALAVLLLGEIDETYTSLQIYMIYNISRFQFLSTLDSTPSSGSTSSFMEGKFLLSFCVWGWGAFK